MPRQTNTPLYLFEYHYLIPIKEKTKRSINDLKNKKMVFKKFINTMKKKN